MAQMRHDMHGRQTLYTSAAEISSGNVREIVQRAMELHGDNVKDIEYLERYYRGEQPILGRTKAVRPEICNKLVLNIANEIVSFKVGYLCGEPIQYVNRTKDEQKGAEITRLNDMMTDISKINMDREIVEWQMICGTAYRMVLPNKEDEDESPFVLYTLDPRVTFVVYSDRVGNKPMLGVHYRKDTDGKITYSCYTKTSFFEWTDDGEIREELNPMDAVPIVEYPANRTRIGAFETVLTILDAINNIESNRVDGIEQFVQAFMKFINCDIDETGWEKFRAEGMIKIKCHDGQNADVDMVTSQLDQSQSQTLRDDLYTAVLTICGMPNRNKNSGRFSSSDTGIAVELRDGWSAAETRAKDSENMFKPSERRMLALVTKLCRELGDLDLKQHEIDIKFTRRNFEGIQAKSQVLTTMLQQPQIHPLLAFTACGLFTDPESAYQMSEKWYEEYQVRQLEKQRAEAEISAQTGGDEASGASNDEREKTEGGSGPDMTNAKNRQVKSYIRDGKRVKAYTR